MKRKNGVAGRSGPLLVLMEEAFGFEPSLSSGLVEQGAVYVDGRRIRDPRVKVFRGAKLTAVLEESGGEEREAAAFSLRVLFEDDQVLVVDKPAGLPAQPTPSKREGNLLALATAHLKREAGLVHRLDKDTTGVTVFGKTKESTSALAAAFREGHAKKTYFAAVGGTLPERGTIDLPLSKDPSRPGRWRGSKKANGIEAHTDYERRGQGSLFAVVALFPLTGRTHQLRAHLKAIDAPILGDALYGGAKLPARDGGPMPERCLLHAARLEIDGRFWEAPMPDDLKVYFEALGADCATRPFAVS